jgi:hypothetical protein
VPAGGALWAAAAVRFIATQFAVPHQEVLGAIFLNSRTTPCSEVLLRGTFDRAAVSPAPILRSAHLAGATGLILCHTHPSGDPSPCLDHVAFTKVVRDSARSSQVRLHDHLIVAHPLQPTKASPDSMRERSPTSSHERFVRPCWAGGALKTRCMASSSATMA